MKTSDVPTWDSLIETERSKPYYQQLSKLVKEARANGTVFPESADVLRCFRLTPFDKVKVLILGQDPYHTPGVADGLAFSSKGKRPPSLEIIFKQIWREYRDCRHERFSLDNWAKQGVLLLNPILTVKAGEAKSHAKFGWQFFTENMIAKLIMLAPNPIVFMFWGKDAKENEKLFAFGEKSKRHLILKAAHPAAELYNEGAGFLGCGHFKQANDFLIKQSLEPINWNT